MKISAVICVALAWSAVPSFGQSTNPVPHPTNAVARVELPKAMPAPKPAPVVTVNQPVVNAAAQLPPLRRVHKKTPWWFGTVEPKPYGKMVEGVFRPDNDQAGDASIRDTVVVIFPTGR